MLIYVLPPGIGTALILGGVSILLLCAYLKIAERVLRFREVLSWVVLLFTGVWLNLVVLLANGGFMPATGSWWGLHFGILHIGDIYCPMASARLPWLGDWIFGFISLGDLLVFVALIGFVITLKLYKERNYSKGGL
jgi:hypothetical protein